MIPSVTDSIFFHFPMLVVPIALVYGATRHEQPLNIVVEACRWLYRLVMFLGTIAAVVFLMTWLI